MCGVFPRNAPRTHLAKVGGITASSSPAAGRYHVMGKYSTVGIWTRCPSCRDEAVAVVQFGGSGDAPALLLDFRCSEDCDPDSATISRGLRLTVLDRAS